MSTEERTRSSLFRLARVLWVPPLLVSVACSVHQGEVGRVVVTQEPIDVAAKPSPSGVPAAPGEQDRGEIEAVIVEATRFLSAGRTGIAEGRIADASDAFDRAVETILQSGYDLEEEPALEGALRNILAEIEKHRSILEAQGTGADDGEAMTEGVEPAVIDKIAEIDEIPQPIAGPTVEPQPQPVNGPESPVKVYGDMPLVMNDSARRLIRLYQTAFRDEINEGLNRSGRFLPMIREVFAQEGLPMDLALLALVESNFKIRAYSRAQAAGIWQFISSTGRLYGLHSNWWMDERFDPEKATRAAARHLKDLYADFGDWYLAMAAYNAGSGKVSRAIARTGSRDFWTLASSRHLRSETKNYVPAYIAAVVVATDPAAYGFAVTPYAALDFEKVRVDGFADFDILAESAGVSVDVVRDLNPELLRNCVPEVPGGYELRLPSGTSGRFAERFAAIPPSQRVKFYTHQVRSGETVSMLARKFGTSELAICSMNKIGNVRKVSVGTVLMIPSNPEYRARTPVAAASNGSRRASSQDRGVPAQTKTTYLVRRGDTITSIARKFDTSIGSIIESNNLRSGHLIYVGQRLVIHGRRDSGGGDRSAQSVYYKVRAGDNLYRIALKYNTSVEKIMDWNNLSVAAMIYTGQRLKILQE